MTATPDEAPPQTHTDVGTARFHLTLQQPTVAEQRTARIMGAWFLGTFVFSIPAFWFYDPLLIPATSPDPARTPASPPAPSWRSAWPSAASPPPS